MMRDEQLFILDVGTRKVAGLIISRGEAGPQIRAWKVIEHPERAMIDGMVHHVDKAAKVVSALKRELEAELGSPLSDAHVAVAGRSLLASEARFEFTLGTQAPLTRSDVLGMELQAVKSARAALSDARASAGCHCVGYSVLRYELDGVEIRSLEGHSGEKAAIKVLATFLPKMVLDSLSAVLRLSGLGLASLTLEPMAAVELAVPEDLRRLNLCLVDVGAGTSDLALTQDGQVAAYAMVPLAGDEISEALCDSYLLDFQQAESLKRWDPSDGEAEVRDVFGQTRRLGAAQVWDTAFPAIQRWAQEVAAKILELNKGKAPQATLLVGGGSQCPGMEAELAKALGVPASRVGRRPASLQNVFEILPEGLNEAWCVTPLGMAALALRERGLPFAHYRVNDARVQVLRLNQRVTAFDALLAAGKDMSEFFPRPGLALTYEWAGQARVEKGGMGVAARLRVNGSPAEFDQEIQPGDSLNFSPARPGHDASLTVSQALEREGLGLTQITLNGEARDLAGEVWVNGRPSSLDEPLLDRARLEPRLGMDISSLLAAQGVDLQGLISRGIAVTLNGEPRVLTQRNYRLKINSRDATLEAQLKSGDVVEFDPSASFQERVRDLLPGMSGSGFVRLLVNQRPFQAPASAPKITMNGREVSADEFLIDGAEISTEGAARLHLFELLARLPLDKARQDARRYETLVNGQAVGFNAVLRDGDEVSLLFDGVAPPLPLTVP